MLKFGAFPSFVPSASDLFPVDVYMKGCSYLRTIFNEVLDPLARVTFFQSKEFPLARVSRFGFGFDQL